MICRMCLNESFNLIEIFGEEGHQMGISSVISDHFWFQPTIDDPVSTSICNDCWRNTESFHVFYLNVKTAQDLLAAAQPVAYVKAEPEEPFEYPNTKSLVSGGRRSDCDNYQSTINVSGSDFTTDSNSGTSFAQKTEASYANQSALSREGLLKTEPDDYGEVSYTDSQLISPNIALLNEEGMDVGSTALLPSNETACQNVKTQRRRSTLSVRKKLEILNCLRNNEKRRDISLKYNVDPSTISRILKDEQKIREYTATNGNIERERLRKGIYEKLDDTMKVWYDHLQGNDVYISNNAIKEEARKFAAILKIPNFTPNNGWLFRWKIRNNINIKKKMKPKNKESNEQAKTT